MKQMNNRIRELRRRSGISQEKLAAALNLTQASISLYETGGNIPTDMLVAIAEYFRVSVDYLLCRTDERLTAKEYKEKDSYELSEFMSAHTITVGGVVVSDADKRRICDMATGLFWTRITATEKKN